MKKILLVVLAGFLTGFGVLNFLPNDNTGDSPKDDLEIQSSENGSAINPPVSPDSQEVRYLGLNYTLQGKVREFRAEGTGYILVLDTENPSIPQFTTSDSTIVVRRVGTEDQEATYKDIRESSDVMLGTSYDLRSKSWKLHRIILLQDASLSR
jgi:hypothetical protein